MFLLQSHLFFHDVNNHAIHPYIIEMDLEVILDYQLDPLVEQEKKKEHPSTRDTSETFRHDVERSETQTSKEYNTTTSSCYIHTSP